jgi:hypothetical protein
MNNNNVKLSSIVWDKDSLDWFQVRSMKGLDYVNKNWETRFVGIDLTENNISLFFSDLEPTYESESIIKYRLFKNEQMLKCLASFYSFYNRKDDPHFIPYSILTENNIAIQFNAGNELFKGFYRLKNNRRTYVKYVHELQNIFDSLIEYNKCTKTVAKC